MEPALRNPEPSAAARAGCSGDVVAGGGACGGAGATVEGAAPVPLDAEAVAALGAATASGSGAPLGAGALGSGARAAARSALLNGLSLPERAGEGAEDTPEMTEAAGGDACGGAAEARGALLGEADRDARVPVGPTDALRCDGRRG